MKNFSTLLSLAFLLLLSEYTLQKELGNIRILDNVGAQIVMGMFLVIGGTIVGIALIIWLIVFLCRLGQSNNTFLHPDGMRYPYPYQTRPQNSYAAPSYNFSQGPGYAPAPAPYQQPQYVDPNQNQGGYANPFSS